MALTDPSKCPSATSKTLPSNYDSNILMRYSTYPIKEDFLRAAESQGIPTVDDLQDLTTGHGAEHWLKWINRDVCQLLSHDSSQ